MTDARHVRSPGFEMAANFNGQGSTIRLAGELDLSVAPRLEQKLNEARAAHSKRIVVDMNELSFIDSAGIQALIGTTHSGGTEGCELVLARPTGQVRRLLELAGLDKWVTIVED
jgi:anti-sigma B factor antagonist